MATYRSLLVVLALLAPTDQPADQPADQPVATYACRADTKFGKHTVSLHQGIDAQAPATVPANARFTIAVHSQPGTLPSEVKGFKLQEVRDLTLHIPVPANAAYVSATLIGGSGLNSTPAVQLEGNTAVVKVPGPIPGGATFQLPTMSIRLKSGRRGSTIETKLKGTSFDDPGLTLTAKIKWKFISTTAPVACYPDPNPALTTTRVQ
jgi:dehydratase